MALDDFKDIRKLKDIQQLNGI